MNAKNYRGCRNVLIIMLTIVFLAPVARAQESEKSHTYKIEVKDGKVYVNGEVVKELDDKDANVFFDMDSDHEAMFLDDDERDSDDAAVWSQEDLLSGRMRGNVFFRRNGDPSPPRAYGMFNWSGDPDENEMIFELERPDAPAWNRLRERIGSERFGFFGDSEGSREIEKMERESREMARSLRRAEEADRPAMEKKLGELLNQIFDAKQEMKQSQVERLAEQLHDLQGRVDDRAAAKEDIVRRRMKELLGEHDAYDW